MDGGVVTGSKKNSAGQRNSDTCEAECEYLERGVSKTQTKSVTLNLERVACTGKAPGLLGRPKVSPSRLLIKSWIGPRYRLGAK